jgi:hypothetical protein
LIANHISAAAGHGPTDRRNKNLLEIRWGQWR